MSPVAVLAAARQCERPRVPFFIDGTRVGSVAVEHLWALPGETAGLQVCGDDVRLLVPAGERDAALARINATLRQLGLIHGWRDEVFAVPDLSSGAVLARIERAAARFWGTLTLGAHANGYRADATGHPTHLWISQRALDKPTDPGLLDNLVGGGVPWGQTPAETLWREAWEEAGVPLDQARRARPVGIVELRRDIPEGFQFERLHAFDLELPRGFAPVNQDGEVARIECLAVQQVVAESLWASMTVDAAVVTLDFLVRHHLLADPDVRHGIDALRSREPFPIR